MPLNTRELLISDLKKAPPELINSLFEFWTALKLKAQKDEPKGHPMSSFFGILSEKDAGQIETVIEEEFSNIEGEW